MSKEINFAKRTIEVQGQKIELANGPKTEIHLGSNLSQEMARVASQIAWWSSVKAAAIAEESQVDALYRQWRAKAILEVLKRDPKTAEWKCKALIEALPMFLDLKKAVSFAAENVAACDGYVQAFMKKANILQSRGANLRAELETQDLSTPEESRKPKKLDRDVTGTISEDDEPEEDEEEEDDFPPSWGGSGKELAGNGAKEEDRTAKMRKILKKTKAGKAAKEI